MTLITDSFDRADSGTSGLGVTDTGETWLYFEDAGWKIVSNKAGIRALGTNIAVVDALATKGTIKGRMSGLAGIGGQGGIGLLAGYNSATADDWVAVRTYSFPDYVELVLHDLDGTHTLWSAGVTGCANGTVRMGLIVDGEPGALVLTVLGDDVELVVVETDLAPILGSLWGMTSTANNLGNIDDLSIDPVSDVVIPPPTPDLRSSTTPARTRFT